MIPLSRQDYRQNNVKYRTHVIPTGVPLRLLVGDKSGGRSGGIYLEALTKPDGTNKEPLRGTIRTDFSAALEMTVHVLLECLRQVPRLRSG